MLLNGNTGSHDIYRSGRRALKKPLKKPAQVDPRPRGSLEERCAWMRERQAAKELLRGAEKSRGKA